MTAQLVLKHILIVLVAVLCASPNTFAGDAEEAQKQGMTVQEYKALQGKRWNSSIAMGYYRGIDEFAEEFIYSSLGTSYKYNESWIVGAALDYLVPSDLEADNPSKYGLLDAELYISKPNFGKTRGGNRVGFSNKLTLPTSEDSSRNGFIASSITTFSVTKQPLPLPRLTLIGSASLVLSHYRFEEDISGENVYSPFGLVVAGTARLSILESLAWSNSYSVYNRIDYESQTKLVQTLSTSLSYIITDTLSASVAYRWQDNYITNDVFLDDNKSRTSVGLSYLF